MTEKIRLTIQESIQTATPHIISNLTMQLKESIKEMVNDAVQSLKVELTSRIQNTVTFSENRSALLTLSEAELLESYNRRDNVRILGLPEESTTSPTDKGETYEKSNENVLQLSNKLKAGLDEKDISSAHRLRARNGGPRPIIVRFSRMMAKINLLKKRRNYSTMKQRKPWNFSKISPDRDLNFSTWWREIRDWRKCGREKEQSFSHGKTIWRSGEYKDYMMVVFCSITVSMMWWPVSNGIPFVGVKLEKKPEIEMNTTSRTVKNTNTVRSLNNFDFSYNANAVDSQEPLTILNTNIRSLDTHFDEFEAYLKTKTIKANILAFTETWLTESSNLNKHNLEGYHKLVTCNWSDGNRGGVGLFIDKRFAYQVQLKDTVHERLIVKIMYPFEAIIFVTYRRDKKFSKSQYCEWLELELTRLRANKGNVFVCGDFNIDLLVPTIHSTELQDIMRSNNLELRSPLEVTTAQGNSKTCLDHIYSDNPVIENHVYHSTITDYFMVWVKFEKRLFFPREE